MNVNKGYIVAGLVIAFMLFFEIVHTPMSGNMRLS